MLTTVIKTPIKNLELRVDIKAEVITGLNYTNKSTGKTPNAVLIKETISQLKAYFKEGSYQFDLPLQFTGTEHQQKLWKALTKIPPGQTKTYGELATTLKSSAQAIGNACRANPISIIVPCH